MNRDESMEEGATATAVLQPESVAALELGGGDLTALARETVAAARECHRTLGTHANRSAYQTAMVQMLEAKGLSCQRDLWMAEEHCGHTLRSGYTLDLVVRGTLLVCINAGGEIHTTEVEELVRLLQLSGLRLGLLIDFECTRLQDGIKRVAYDDTASALV